MARLSREIQLRRADLVIEAVRQVALKKELLEQEILESVTSFYIWRTDNNQVLARGVMGYESARDKANELRKRFNLKWDQVKFKSERKSSSGRTSSGAYKAASSGRKPTSAGRIDYSRNYNPSKRGRFRGVYDSQGNYADLD